MKKKILIYLLVASVLISASGCSKENFEHGSEIQSSTVQITPIEPSSSESSSEEISSSESSESSSDSESVQEQSSVPEIPLTCYNALILVNPTHYIPEDYTVELVKVQGKYNMDIKAAESAKALLKAAKEAGFDMALCSAYRTVEKSAELYAKQVQKFKNAGYSEEEAKKEAAKWVAPPGTSEHHTGLAMDLVSTDYWAQYSDLEHDYENFDSFKWLYEHCAEFGFILRYPKDKQDITGITYEPWHYRYVGVEAAKYIMENGLCLEEYLGILN